MRTPTRSLRTRSLVAAAAALILTVTVAAPAEAAAAPSSSWQIAGSVVDHCTGTKLKTLPLRKDGTGAAQGRVELWYSSARSGTNCVMTYDALGGSHWMAAELWVQKSQIAYRPDKGTYTTYAGGSQITGTDGDCVWFTGTVKVGSSTYWATNGAWQYCN